MSVLDLDKIDNMFFGEEEETETLYMIIKDNLEWDNENDHINKLNDKISMYIDTWERGNLAEIFPDKNMKKAIVGIEFEHELPVLAIKFMLYVNKQLEEKENNMESKYKEPEDALWVGVEDMENVMKGM